METVDCPSNEFVVAAMYKFVQLADYVEFRDPLLDFCLNNGIKGTFLLAAEGINGTVSGYRSKIDKLLAYLKSDPRLADIESKYSFNVEAPFYRMKVKLKKEIVTMGVPGTDPEALNGIRVDPRDWNDLISDPEVLLIDTRNQYEYGIGTFKHAVSPETRTFREFPAYVKQHLNREKHRKIAMFCTGGIRCEKATNYLLQQGFDQVYHLNGGILKYLEEVPAEESLWQGECFVFDNRVSINEYLEKGIYEQCFACRRPISAEDMQSEYFEKGVSCPHCYGEKSGQKLEGLRERQKQVELAEKRNEKHIGVSQEVKTKGTTKGVGVT